MRFLILGCNGMAGHMIGLYLKEQGHEVEGFARTEAGYIDTIVGDARDLKLVKGTVQQGRYDAVVNGIGLLNQAAENDHEAAVLLNSYFPQLLAKITEEMETHIIHISTDCVFSGSRGG